MSVRAKSIMVATMNKITSKLKLPTEIPERLRFPDPEKFQGDRPFIWRHGVDVDLLIEAYSHGIFPWPSGEGPIGWHCPDPRGVLFFRDFHVPKNFQKELKKNGMAAEGKGRFRCTWCEDFDAVIEGCRSVKRAGDAGTWITEEMIEAYRELFAAGGAWSVEVWDDGDSGNNSQLIGGLYGTHLYGVYGGESMFSSVTNASKYGLIFLCDQLLSMGVEWIDTQTLSPIIEQFGGLLIARSRFFELLRTAQKSFFVKD